MKKKTKKPKIEYISIKGKNDQGKPAIIGYHMIINGKFGFDTEFQGK